MPTTNHAHSSTASQTPTPTSSSSLKTSQSSSSTTTIIVAVAASVVGIILIFIVVRLIRHRINRNSSSPLPPVQPIAHHREQQLAQFEEQKFFPPTSGSGGNQNGYGSRSSTWYAGQHLTAPQFSPSSGSTSDASLLPHHNRDSDGDAPTADASLHHEMSVIDEKSLSPPSPPFQGMAATTTMMTSDNNIATSSESDTGLPGDEPSNPRISSSSSSARPRAHSSNFNSSHPPSNIPNPNPYPTLRHPRTRPSSLHSSASRRSTATAMSNVNIIRGAPHGPHSSVQIVLPAPLAPGLGAGAGAPPYGYGRRSDEFGVMLEREGSMRSRSRVDSYSRLSVVDKWAGLPSGSSDSLRERGRESGRGREKERRLLKKVERKASSGSASANINADRRNSTSPSHSYASSHQSHSLSHHPYPHPPSKSPLFRSYSPNIHTPSPSPPLQNNPNSISNPHPSSSSPSPSLLPLRTSASAPPLAFRNHSLTPPPVPRIPSMYNNNTYSYNNQFRMPEVEVERGRRPTPPAGFGFQSPAPTFPRIQRGSPGPGPPAVREYDARTATSTPDSST